MEDGLNPHPHPHPHPNTNANPNPDPNPNPNQVEDGPLQGYEIPSNARLGAELQLTRTLALNLAGPEP